jgi:hypothetical protein
MNVIFNFNRAGLLVQRYFSEKLHRELIYWSIMSVLFMFFRNQPVAIGFAILTAGIFYAARFSREIHSPANGISYFMIPATQLEKIAVSLFLAIVYYFALMMMAYVVGNLVGTALNNLLAGIDFLSSDLNLFHHSSLKWRFFESVSEPKMLYINDVLTPRGNTSLLRIFFETFLITQSIFVLGGIYFKRSQTLKTLFMLIIIGFMLFVLLITEMELIVGIREISHQPVPPSEESISQWTRMLGTTANVFRWALLPFLWITSYFRLTEKEV